MPRPSVMEATECLFENLEWNERGPGWFLSRFVLGAEEPLRKFPINLMGRLNIFEKQMEGIASYADITLKRLEMQRIFVGFLPPNKFC